MVVITTQQIFNSIAKYNHIYSHFLGTSKLQISASNSLSADHSKLFGGNAVQKTHKVSKKCVDDTHWVEFWKPNTSPFRTFMNVYLHSCFSQSSIFPNFQHKISQINLHRISILDLMRLKYEVHCSWIQTS